MESREDCLREASECDRLANLANTRATRALEGTDIVLMFLIVLLLYDLVEAHRRRPSGWWRPNATRLPAGVSLLGWIEEAIGWPTLVAPRADVCS